MGLKEVLILANKVLQRSKFYLLGGAIAGSAIGYYLNLRPKVYETKFSIESTVVNPNSIAEVVYSFGRSIDQEQFDHLNRATGCEKDVLKSIVSIDDVTILTTSNPINSEQWSVVTMTLQDPTMATLASECILQYISSNQAINSRISTFVKTRTEALKEINQKIEELNIHLREYLRILKSDKPLPMGVYGGGGYQEMLLLLDKRTLITEEIERGRNIRIGEPAYTPAIPVKGSFRNFIIGLLSGLFLGGFIAVFAEIKRYIRT